MLLGENDAPWDDTAWVKKQEESFSPRIVRENRTHRHFHTRHSVRATRRCYVKTPCEDWFTPLCTEMAVVGCHRETALSPWC